MLCHVTLRSDDTISVRNSSALLQKKKVGRNSAAEQEKYDELKLQSARQHR
jgi:hypothetical protein